MGKIYNTIDDLMADKNKGYEIEKLVQHREYIDSLIEKGVIANGYRNRLKNCSDDETNILLQKIRELSSKEFIMRMAYNRLRFNREDIKKISCHTESTNKKHLINQIGYEFRIITDETKSIYRLLEKILDMLSETSNITDGKYRKIIQEKEDIHEELSRVVDIIKDIETKVISNIIYSSKNIDNIRGRGCTISLKGTEPGKIKRCDTSLRGIEPGKIKGCTTNLKEILNNKESNTEKKKLYREEQNMLCKLSAISIKPDTDGGNKPWEIRAGILFSSDTTEQNIRQIIQDNKHELAKIMWVAYNKGLKRLSFPLNWYKLKGVYQQHKYVIIVYELKDEKRKAILKHPILLDSIGY